MRFMPGRLPVSFASVNAKSGEFELRLDPPCVLPVMQRGEAGPL